MLELFKKLEERDADATDEVVSKILDRYSSVEASLAQASAIETCASIYGRAFMAAAVTSANVFDQQTLYRIGQAIVRRGAYVAFVFGNTLIDASVKKVNGSLDRSRWTWTLTYDIPNGTRERSLSDDQVIYVAYSHQSRKPYHAKPQYEIADDSSKMLESLISALTDETNTPRGQLLPVPARDGKSSTLDDLKAAISALRGRLMLLESANTLANVQGQTRSNEYESRRIGAQIPQSLIQLYETARDEVYGVYGVPHDLVTNTDGTGRREAWRQFLFGTVAPIGKLIQAEFRAKYDATFRLDFEELRASDLTGRARAFQSLVGGGMEMAQAAALSGLLVEDA